MTRFFYDTEFLEDGKTIELISIGIVTEHGDTFYAVNAGMPWSRIVKHDWLRQNVLPSLPTVFTGTGRAALDIDHAAVQSTGIILGQVESFIIEHGDDHRKGNELWAYYGAYDHVALCQLWGRMIDLPRCVPMFTHELMQLWQLAGRPDKPSNNHEHHALADAEWNLELYRTCRTALDERGMQLDPEGGVWLR